MGTKVAGRAGGAIGQNLRNENPLDRCLSLRVNAPALCPSKEARGILRSAPEEQRNFKAK